MSTLTAGSTRESREARRKLEEFIKISRDEFETNNDQAKWREFMVLVKGAGFTPEGLRDLTGVPVGFAGLWLDREGTLHFRTYQRQVVEKLANLLEV